jgi:hypothetical protein
MTMYSEHGAATGVVELRPASLRRISWGAIFAGVVMVVAVQILLAMLAAAIGLGAIEPGSGESASAARIGISGAAWWTLSNLIALVIGGLVSARLAGVTSRFDGLLHGLLTWAFALIITLWLLTTALASVMGGTLSMFGSMVGSVGKGVATQIQGADPTAKLLAPSDASKLTPEQAKSELGAAMAQMARGGPEADKARERVIDIVAGQAGISREEATQRLEAATAQLKGGAAAAADKTADAASRASIWGFVALLLGAIAGALGGLAGTTRRSRHAAVDHVRPRAYREP